MIKVKAPISAKIIFLSLTVFISGCGGGSSDSEPEAITPPPPVAKTELTPAESSAFLNRATFGATSESINELANSNVEDWLTSQRSQPISRLLPYILSLPNQEEIFAGHRVEGWWLNTVKGPDQLRQRVAFALSEILVVSDQNDFLFNYQNGMAAYYDILLENAFGNYRDLLEEVTLSPAMGVYLSMLGNQKPDVENNIRPDENFAREVMQLFTIGLVELNLDGSVKTDTNGAAIPSYDQDTIEGFAHVFTGWTFAGASRFRRAEVNAIDPMEPWEDYHDTGEKILLNDFIVPAGQTAQQDLTMAMDNLFAHDNVAPFISFRLIQRLVTSNPSPEYISRVATVFNDNGQGTKGDLWAVVVAILMDEEAMNGANTRPNVFGKLREPLIRTAHLFRVLKAETLLGTIPFRWPDYVFGQSPQRPKSVFNFYHPDYQQPGAIAEGNLYAPEFQLSTANNLTGMHNSVLYFSLYTNDGSGVINDDDILVDTDDLELLAADHGALVDELNLVFIAGQMTESMREEIIAYLDLIHPHVPTRTKVLEAVLLILTSSEYAIQR